MSQTFPAYPALLTESLAFPSVEHALTDPNGLLAVGGDLSPERIIEAYKNGIFPWFSEQDPILWWSPCPRAIIPIENIHINKTLKKVIKRGEFTVTMNQEFEEVIRTCADAPFRKEGTWILEPMVDAYLQLHKLGQAHSIEVYKNSELVGGLYGIAINGFFSGESMFYKASNASKIALVALSRLLDSIGVGFIDCQLQNPFLEDMGCIEIPRATFTTLKSQAMAINIPVNFWLPKNISIL